MLRRCERTRSPEERRYRREAALGKVGQIVAQGYSARDLRQQQSREAMSQKSWKEEEEVRSEEIGWTGGIEQRLEMFDKRSGRR